MPRLKKQSKQDKEVDEFHIFVCITCDTKGDNPMEHEQMIEHLKKVHHLETPIKGSRNMTLHLDCSTWYQSNYEWTIGDIHLVEQSRYKRSADDPMRIND